MQARTYRFTAIVVLEHCFVGRIFAYGSRGPLLRRLIILTSTPSRLHASLTLATCTSVRSDVTGRAKLGVGTACQQCNATDGQRLLFSKFAFEVKS